MFVKLKNEIIKGRINKMFIYQEEESKCEKFINEDDWYIYPWHSDSEGIIFPGKVIKYWLDLGIKDWNDIKDQESISIKTTKIFTSEYKNAGLNFNFEHLSDYPIPHLRIEWDDDGITNNVYEQLLLPDMNMSNLHLIEAATIGYLRNKNITVQGIVYGSDLHNQLNVFVCD